MPAPPGATSAPAPREARVKQAGRAMGAFEAPLRSTIGKAEKGSTGRRLGVRVGTTEWGKGGHTDGGQNARERQMVIVKEPQRRAASRTQHRTAATVRKGDMRGPRSSADVWIHPSEYSADLMWDAHTSEGTANPIAARGWALELWRVARISVFSCSRSSNGQALATLANGGWRTGPQCVRRRAAGRKGRVSSFRVLPPAKRIMSQGEKGALSPALPPLPCGMTRPRGREQR